MKRIAGLLPAILLCAAPVFAQGNPYPNPPKGPAAEAGTIQGRVSYPNGKPAVNVELELDPQSSWGDSQTATTNGAGSFSFSRLAVGNNYSITGQVAGYKAISRLLMVSGQITYVNITLTPLAGEPIPLTATVPVEYANVPPEAYERFHRGVLAQDNGKVREAEADFRDAVRIDPSFASAYMRLSAIYASQNRFDEARKAIRKSLKLKKHSAEGYAYLGYLYIREKRTDKAEAAIRKSLAISNHNWLAHLEMGRLRYQQKQYAQAYGELKLARRLRPQSPSANLLLYDVLIRLRKDKEALAELDEILKVFPGLPEAAKLKQMRPALAAIVGHQRH